MHRGKAINNVRGGHYLSLILWGCAQPPPRTLLFVSRLSTGNARESITSDRLRPFPFSALAFSFLPTNRRITTHDGERNVWKKCKDKSRAEKKRKKKNRRELDDFVPDSLSGISTASRWRRMTSKLSGRGSSTHINRALLRFLSSLTITPVSSHSAYY